MPFIGSSACGFTADPRDFPATRNREETKEREEDAKEMQMGWT